LRRKKKIKSPFVDVEKEKKYLEILKKIVLEATKNKDCKVFLFGSRARGDFVRSSDADVGIEGLKDREFLKVKRYIEDRVEESVIPFDVDIVNFDKVSVDFKSEALKDAIRWK